jgi:hypothetical protein
MSKKLFAVYLGGRADKCNTELHDVVFAVGEKITDTYEQLLDQWFGIPKGLHLDSWMELDIVDGYRITLVENATLQNEKLFYVNLGAYRDGDFTEIHAHKFLVAPNAAAAKARGKKELLQNWPLPVHTDDLHAVDDCLELGSIGGFHIHLEKTDQPQNLTPTNGYHLIPKGIAEDYTNTQKQHKSLFIKI